jgi:hypothetical protein
VSDGSPRARLEAAVGDDPVVGVGWATVDLDRAIDEIADGVGLSPDAFVEVPPSVALGAQCRAANASLGVRDVVLVILEPITEGRLAGHLARYDEGPAVIWSGDGHAGARTGPATAASATPGPLGPETLLPSEADRPGLLRFIVNRPAGTIRG